MKTSVLDAHGMLSVLSVDDVEKRIGEVPGVLYPFVLSPEIAALSMSGSTLIVAVNALMLKRTKLAGMKRAPQDGTPATARTSSGTLS